MKVFEMKLKVYLLKDIETEKLLAREAGFIDSALAKESKWLDYHEENQFKNYCFNGCYPLEREGVYKKDKIYTITIRTVDAKLAKYFYEVLKDHHNPFMKGLTIEGRILPQKRIREIYSLTPVIQKSDDGYWKNQMSLDEFEKHLFENAIKKYKQYTGEDLNEDFQLYTGFCFLNKNPIPNEYKKIRLLGDKINLKIADEEQAQKIAYFLLGTGICELNSRGFGYCNYRWV